MKRNFINIDRIISQPAIKVVLLSFGLLCALIMVVNVYSKQLSPSQAGIARSKTGGQEKICHRVKKVNKHNAHKVSTVTVCEKKQLYSFEAELDEILNSLSPAQKSLLEEKLVRQRQVVETRAGISFYEPTYILPYYYTARPYQSIYKGSTPNNEPLNHQEFKGQLSFQFPIWYNMFRSQVSLNISYTQLSYWQFYNKSQFFRETDYEPQLFLTNHFSQNALGAIGINHQSNGLGGNLERSWNRLFLDFTFTGAYWMLDIKPWILIFSAESSDIHNPDICHYLGYGRVVFAVTFYHQVVSLMLRNTIASGFKRGAIEFSYSFPIHGLLQGYIQFFSGYGQSLIEYNHYTNSIGIGFIINNWI